MAATPAAPEPEYIAPNASSAGTIVIAVAITIGALRLGRELLLPIVLAMLLTLLLSAPVRFLRRKRIPERVGAAIVVFGALGIGVGAASMLVAPATQWIADSPKALHAVDVKLHKLTTPIAKLQETASQMGGVTGTSDAAPVKIETPGLVERVTMQGVAAIPAVLSVIFLTYFLLASGPMFRKKIARIYPGRHDVVRIESLLSEIEIVTSRYLATTTMINIGVGGLTALATWAAGVPNWPLWGALAAVLNFIPYLGPIVTATVIALASFSSFPETSRALIGPALFVLIHLTESNFVTPTLLGRRLPVNTLTIFIGLLFFAWMWGIPGAVIAVPLTVVLKIACDHLPAMSTVGEWLGS
jgi:predicted PurR-regulated permease PerM